MTIHFICRGNVLRSLIAETYLKSLKLPNITVISSGAVADKFRDTDGPYFEKTVDLLTSHGLKEYIKPRQEQLTQERVNQADITVLMNERVVSDSKEIVTLPNDIIVWNIVDIGEGTRIAKDNERHDLEEIIFNEIIQKVDELVKTII